MICRKYTDEVEGPGQESKRLYSFTALSAVNWSRVHHLRRIRDFGRTRTMFLNLAAYQVLKYLKNCESCLKRIKFPYHLPDIHHSATVVYPPLHSNWTAQAAGTLVKKLQISCVGWLFSSSGVSATIICSCAVWDMMSSFCQHTHTHVNNGRHVQWPHKSYVHQFIKHFNNPFSIFTLFTPPPPPSGTMWLHSVANCCKF